MFTHLHVHSTYSLLDSTITIPDLIEAVKRQGMKAVALTDTVAMYGAIEFYTQAKRAGLQPLLGCEFQIVSSYQERTKKPFALVVLAETYQGYQNLLRAISHSQCSAQYGIPQITLADLLEFASGWIVLTGGRRGELADYLLQQQYDQAKIWLQQLTQRLGSRQVYVQIEDFGLLDDKLWIKQAAALAQELGVPVVATNDVHYLQPSDAFVHDVVYAIRTGQTLQTDHEHILGTDQAYLKTAAEMAEQFAWIPAALLATEEIVSRCKACELPIGQTLLPRFPLPADMPAIEYLKRLCVAGAKKRFGRLSEPVIQRLKYELEIIERLGFADYFLVVYDFMRFAHEQGIATGPGRGSAAGSLVSFVLRITDVDPLKYGLLFQRFLNPERITWPDIDIDFEYERRHEVIQYVVDRYGADRVAQIITFGTLAARAAVRDLGRVLNLQPYVVDRVAKLIPSALGMTIDNALKQEPRLMQLYEQDSQVKQLLDLAKRVEGFPRHTSVHAAGVVISNSPLTDHTPMQPGAEAGLVTQYAMESIEKVGLLKMDFLGLKTLSVIRQTLQWIQTNHGQTLTEQEIPEEDPNTFALLCRGDTDGCFQLESFGVKNVLRELKPSHLEDIIAVISLYRPGPMENIDTFIKAKHGQIPVRYPHPSLEPILKDTYGIIVYQEQIMQIASVMAGFSLGQADILRRAVGKKKREVLDEQRQKFVDGCLQQGYDVSIAHTVYDLIVRFADYGFNRSHAAAYAVLAYRTAFLKANFPKEFMASLLTSVLHSQTKVSQYIDDCRQRGIPILPPDINKSEECFTPEPQGIRVALAAIKHIGTHTIHAILSARMKQPFRSLYDFVERIDSRHLNKRVLEVLIQSGSMDGVIPSRRAALGIIDELLEAVQKHRKGRGQIDLFNLDSPGSSVLEQEIPYLHVQEFTHAERLALEYETTGLYVSGHPLDPYQTRLRQKSTHVIAGLHDSTDQQVVIGGRIVSVKFVMTKKQQKMGFFELEDRTGKIECIVFPGQMQQLQDFLQRGTICLCKGRVQGQDGEYKLYVTGLEEVPPDLPTDLANDRQVENHGTIGNGQALYIRIEHESETILQNVRDVLKQYPGDIPVIIVYTQPRRIVQLSDSFLVERSETMVEQLGDLIGRQNVTYAKQP